MPTPTEIVLEYVCPSLGLIVANMMFLAPLNDLRTAVAKGNGLGDLNPTPWAFMLGNCLGWTAYGVLLSNWFVFWANYPGFMIACWLNLGAVKLLYSSHHQAEARKSLVDFLSSSKAFTEAMARRGSIDESGLEKESFLEKTKDNEDVETTGTKKAMDEYDSATADDSSPSSKSTGDDSQKQPQSPEHHHFDWAKIVWDVTSQTTPAKTPHEFLVVGMIFVWTLVLSAIGFYQHYDLDVERSQRVAQNVVGGVVNTNLVFFYGAPLSKIQTVLKTKRSNTLHLPTMVMNTSNAIFWTAYALSPQINDPYIYAPNGLGVVLGTIQFFLWMVFPRKEEEEERTNKKDTAIEMVASA